MNFRSTKIKARLFGILGLTLLSYIVLISLILNSQYNSLITLKEKSTQHVVETAFNIMQVFRNKELSGELTREEAQAKAKEVFVELRYNEDDYFWINDLQPTMVMHPIKKELIGKDLSKFTEKGGKRLFMEFVDIAKAEGQGFIPFLWPQANAKPGDAPVPKIGYIKYFPDWGWILGSGVYIDDVDKEFNSTVYSVIATSAVLYAILVISIVLITQSILRPLTRTVEAMNDIATGDGNLRQRLPENGEDELSHLAEGFNQFIEKISHLIHDATEGAHHVRETVQVLSTSAKSSETLADEQSTQTSSIASAIDEMQATIAEVTRNAISAAEKTASGQKTVENGRKIFDEASKDIHDLEEHIQSATQVIQDLARETHNIGSVLEVIRNIAEQTNLLALNAAIEAARAGEQGRGFAVVADEVRTLANRTQQSTEEIQSMIATLQNGAGNAVQVIEASMKLSEHSTQQVSLAHQTLEDINSAIYAINQLNTQIANAAEQQTATATEINNNIATISHLAQDTAESLHSSSAQTESLQIQGEKLEKQLEHFQV